MPEIVENKPKKERKRKKESREGAVKCIGQTSTAIYDKLYCYDSDSIDVSSLCVRQNKGNQRGREAGEGERGGGGGKERGRREGEEGRGGKERGRRDSPVKRDPHLYTVRSAAPAG